MCGHIAKRLVMDFLGRRARWSLWRRWCESLRTTLRSGGRPSILLAPAPVTTSPAKFTLSFIIAGIKSLIGEILSMLSGCRMRSERWVSSVRETATIRLFASRVYLRPSGINPALCVSEKTLAITHTFTWKSSQSLGVGFRSTVPPSRPPLAGKLAAFIGLCMKSGATALIKSSAGHS